MSLLRSTLFVLSALSLSATAHALQITPGTTAIATGNETGQAAIDAIILPLIAPSTELYKQNVGDAADSGSLAGSYTTTFSNSPLDPADATITYSGGSIVGPTAYLLVKGGSQTPAWYLFDLTFLGWDGMATLDIEGFWPAQGSISHVALYGTAGTPRVPDAGSTLAMLGVGLALVAWARRKLG